MAGYFVYVGSVFERWMSRSHTVPLSGEDYEEYGKVLTHLKANSAKVSLLVFDKLLEGAIDSMTPAVRYCDVALKMGELQRCFLAELDNKLLFLIAPERAKYMVTFETDHSPSPGRVIHVGDELLRFEPVYDAFPSIVYDLENAGNCFAIGCFTACVYHLMRVCELGLVSLAQALDIEAGIASWEKLLRRIREVIEEKDANHPPEWEKDRQFYSEVAVLMLNIKNAWRNPASHIRQAYDEPRARRIFNGVESLMGHLGSRLSEKPLPASSGLVNPES